MTTTSEDLVADPPGLAHRGRAVPLGVKLYLGTSLAVILLMMIAGLAMRLAQAGWLPVRPDTFYQIMTVHGAGMVGISGLASAAVLWFFLRRHVTLSVKVLYLNWVLFVMGVVLILVSIFVGNYGGGWTFLWPLPAKSMGVWSENAAAGFIGGLILIGVGFLAFHLDVGVAIRRRYGSILKGLGVDQLFGRSVNESHPPTVVAASMVTIVNTAGIATGAVVLVVTLVNLYVPAVALDALVAKNLIYFFGHVFINASIYMAVTAVYELLPLYARRPWKVSRPFYAAWFAATVFVMAVYPHHLLMDGVMPHWALSLGQIVSYLSGIPVLLVTTYGALVLIHRSGIEWQSPARWLVLAMFGWSAGVVPAIVDGTIRVNQVMHNTLWVPGHFHFYLLLGLLPMLIGFCLHAFGASRRPRPGVEQSAFVLYGVSSLVFSLAFLFGGWASAPRRWAEHRPQWLPYDRLGAAAAVIIVVAAFIVMIGLLRRLGAPARSSPGDDRA